MPLLETGYQPYDYETWLIKIQNDLKQNFNGDIDLSTGSFYESLAESVARQLAEIDLNSADVYDSRFISLATGTTLDRLATNYGVTRKKESYAHTKVTITGEVGYEVPAGTMFSNNENRNFETTDSVVIGEDGKAVVDVYAEEAGEDYNCEANTITDQVMYVDEIEEVTNTTPASGGQDLENDYNFRQRVKIAGKSATSPTKNGIINAISQISGVTNATIEVNNNPTTNAAGDPPYTTHIYVLGGNQDDIAQAISDNIAAGITLSGDIQKKVKLANGEYNDIRFSAGKQTIIYVKCAVSIDINTEEEQESVKNDIIDNIEYFIQDYEMGSLIPYTKIFGVIYDVEGVKNVTDLQLGTDPEKMGKEDIQLEKISSAAISDKGIEVSFNGQ